MGDLARRIRQKYPGAYDDLNDADLEAKILAKYPRYRDLAGVPAPREKDWGDVATGLLPTVGGIAGGLIGAGAGLFGGGPVGAAAGGVGGAALGGTAGKGVQTAIEAWRHGPSPSMLTDLSGLAKAGGEQAAYEAGGQLVGIPLRALGRSAMQFATRPSAGLAREFPDIAATMVKERLPVGRLPFGTSGSAQAAAKRSLSAAETHRLLTASTQAGETIPTPPLLTKPLERYTALNLAPTPARPRKTLLNEIAEFTRRHQAYQPAWPGAAGGPGVLSPLEAKAMKTLAQEQAEPIYKVIHRGMSAVPEATQIKARFNQDIAAALRGALEALPQYGQRIGASEARTQSLIGAGRAIRAAETRPFSLNPLDARNIAAAALGGADIYAGGHYDPQSILERLIIARLLTSPAVMSRVGLGVTHPLTGRVIPRAVGAAVGE